MNLNFLDFEQPIADLLAKIDELRHIVPDHQIDLGAEITKLEAKAEKLTKQIFASLTDFQIVKLARHVQRPHSLDYFQRIFTDYQELSGDRHSMCGKAIIGGIARLEGEPVMLIGQQKGRDTKENLACNFAMPQPEEYRKALRLMKLAEKFKLPVFTFIDTPGAYPGIAAEEHNQSEAIARNIFEMSKLRTPIVCTLIGEGGSGGALALGVGDRFLMLEYSIYATISPEGCASILWRNQDKVELAAEALHLTAPKLLKLKLIDEIIKEPFGGAHRDYDAAAKSVKEVLIRELAALKSLPTAELIAARQNKISNCGHN